MVDYKKALKEYKTPFYVYDIDELESRVNYIKKSIPKGLKIVYAIKANTFVVKEIDSFVDKFEICSPGEFDICNNLKIDYKKMVISGVNKDEEFIERLISNYDIGRYTIESLEHFDILSRLAKKYNKKIDVLIRLTSGNQFGVSESDFFHVIKNYDKEYLNIEGLEYFSGTQKHMRRIEKEIDYINEFLDKLKNDYNFDVNEVEYGPGLPVEYYKQDEFDENAFFKEFSDCIKRINCKNVLIESGRSLVASCGSYLTSVVDMKSNQTGNYVIVDGGINHLVYYGSTLAMKTPPFEVLGNNTKEKDIYNIYGSLCTTNDVLIKNIELNKLNKSDVFVFKYTGAYSSTEGISLFLSRDLPKIILNKGNDFICVRDIIRTSDINYPDYEKEN